jgi:tetratricopeptide (TPR) repeat protein
MKKVLIILSFLLGASFVSQAQLNINHYIRVGRTRISIGNFTGAIEYFNIVIKFRPYLPEAYFYRGVSKHELEDFRGAINDYNKAIDIKPFYPQAYMNRGMAYHSLKYFEKAIEDYNKALEFDPDNESIYNNRGIAKLSQKNIEGAIADYDKALEINPKSTHALMNRSNARIVEGNTEKAIKDLNKVITIRPHFASAYLNRGLARFEMEDYASALRDYDQCIKFDPENALAYNNRGIVKHKLEDYEGAIMDYNMALKLNSEMASAYFNRAMAREILGREGYEKDYEIAARLNPRFDLESRRLDARQLAQRQQSSQGQSQQGTGSSSAGQGQTGTQQTTAKQQDDDNKEEEERQQQQRRRINLIVEDTRDLPTEDEEVDDGRIQNRNIAIDLQSIFIVSAFEKNSVDYERFQYYNMTIEDINEKNNYNPLMTITNKPVDEYHEVFENFVLYFNARLEINKSSHNYLSRGIFRSLTGNYNAALEDMDSAIIIDSKQAIAYFSRGNCRYKMLEQIESLSETHDEVVISVNETVMDEPDKQPMAIPEYNKIMDDYQTLLYLKSDFFFGYYNRAYIKLRLQRYKSAIEDLNKAIELEPEFAEAYFNRGLTKIYLNDIEGGALDLSRAGELGIYGAYNIIKRYCN